MDAISESTYRKYLKALLAGKREECNRIVNGLLSEGTSIPELYTNLFQRSLYEVGGLWEFHKISVAVEHLATSITESLMSLVYPQLFNRSPSTRSAIVSCASNEYHQVGGRMVADILEMHGWHAYFLGPNTPTRDMLELIHEKQPDLIALSLSVYFNMPNLLQGLSAIRQEFEQIPIIVGGQAFRWGGSEALTQYSNVALVSDLEELQKLAEEGV